MLFRVFGVLEVTGPGGQLRLSAEKPRRMLSTLLLHANRWVPDSELIDAVWPSGPPASAAGNIKSYVSQLRQWLAPVDDHPNRIERQPGAYRLNLDRSELDTMVFVDLVDTGVAEDDPTVAIAVLTEAMELWRGNPFDVLDLPATGAELARITESRWTARQTLADRLLACGDASEAIATLSAMASDDPLREQTWLRLMTALHDSGRRAEALATYQRARRALVDELGIEPGVDLRELHERVLRGDAAVGRPLSPPVEPRARTDSTSRWPRSRVAVLVGLAVVLVASLLVAKWPMAAEDPDLTSAPTDLSQRRPVPEQSVAGSGEMVFGLGPMADVATKSALIADASVTMVTTRYDGPQSLPKLRAWKSNLLHDLKTARTAHHLIVAGPDEVAKEVDTPRGRGCGREYPMSDRFLGDMQELARTFAGLANDPLLYVTVFDGVNSLGCHDGSHWRDTKDQTYHDAVMDRFLTVRNIFHLEAPNARVGLGWRTWAAEEASAESAQQRLMVSQFAKVLAVSDFQSVLSRKPDSNVAPIRNAVDALRAYGPIMVTHGAEDTPAETIERDLRTVFTEDGVAELSRSGVFAWNFAGENLLHGSQAGSDFARQTMSRYGRPSATAANRFGWGSPISRTEFTIGLDSGWEAADGWAGAGTGRYMKAQVTVQGGLAVLSGTPSGDTGLIHRPRDATSGRWETRLRVTPGCTCLRPTLTFYNTDSRDEIVYLKGDNAGRHSTFVINTNGKSDTFYLRSVDLTRWTTVAVDWDATQVTAYINGEQVFDNTDRSLIPQHPLHPTVKLDWVPTDGPVPPTTMEIDWIRQYSPR